MTATHDGSSQPRRYNLEERSAGLLLHPTSLPGPFESGDLGPAAHAFVDFLAAAGLRWWQMLPLGPVGHGSSPYAATSSFAGSPDLVSLELLVEAGLLAKDDAALAPATTGRRADFVASRARREAALRKAFEAAKADPKQIEALDAFRKRHGYWLKDYARFAALKQHFGGQAFFEWPAPLKRRDDEALATFEREHGEEIAFHEFVQLRFSTDLDALVRYGKERGVALMGDAPIYVAHDSAEVWAHPDLFLLGEDGDPAVVAGVPPDAFSDEGQLWGNPLYDWSKHERTGFGFWIARLEHQLRTFDAVRLDHFIGFSRYWAVPRGEKSAKVGTFHPVPGKAMFEAIFRALGPVQLVAEDLGIVTDQVRELRDHFRLPGMSVLQFSFSPGRHSESSRPHRFAKRSVVYTGTHDNDTSAGWLGSPPDAASEDARARFEGERKFALDYLGLPESTAPAAACAELVRAAMRNHADTTIIPVQDVLGLGREARMNRPGVASGNWDFRLEQGELSEGVAAHLRKLAETYGRAV